MPKIGVPGKRASAESRMAIMAETLVEMSLLQYVCKKRLWRGLADCWRHQSIHSCCVQRIASSCAAAGVPVSYNIR